MTPQTKVRLLNLSLGFLVPTMLIAIWLEFTPIEVAGPQNGFTWEWAYAVECFNAHPFAYAAVLIGMVISFILYLMARKG